MSRRLRASTADTRTSRRRFVQWLGATAAVAPLAAALPAAAQTPAPAPPPPAPPTPPAAPPGATPVDPDVAAEARAVTDLIARRFGSRLDDAQLQAIREDAEGLIGAGRTLRKLDLRNADEPDVVFRARPQEV